MTLFHSSETLSFALQIKCHLTLLWLKSNNLFTKLLTALLMTQFTSATDFVHQRGTRVYVQKIASTACHRRAMVKLGVIMMLYSAASPCNLLIKTKPTVLKSHHSSRREESKESKMGVMTAAWSGQKMMCNIEPHPKPCSAVNTPILTVTNVVIRGPVRTPGIGIQRNLTADARKTRAERLSSLRRDVQH